MKGFPVVHFVGWLPNRFIAVIIMLVGLVFADMVADRMLHAKRKGVMLFNGAVRWFMILFIALAAIGQIFAPTVSGDELTEDQVHGRSRLKH